MSSTDVQKRLGTGQFGMRRRLFRHHRQLYLLLCLLASTGCGILDFQTVKEHLPGAPTPIPNVDAGTPPPVVVTPTPDDTTNLPTTGEAVMTDIELPAFIIGGDEGDGTIRLTRGTTQAITLNLSTSDRDVEVVPATLTVPAGQNSVGFRLKTHPPHADTLVRVTATTGAESRTATFTLALPRPINRADSYTAYAGQPLTVPSPGILENDTRRDGHDLTAVLMTSTDFGTLSLNPSGGFTYVPDRTHVGLDRFIYRALDGVVSSGPAHVNIRVLPPLAPPSASSGSSGTASFDFTGGNQTFTVPAGVTQINIDASGGQGAAGFGGALPNRGGLGGRVVATFAVTPGETLTVVVGGQGSSFGGDAFNGGGGGGSGGFFPAGLGGGGGGASDVRRGGTPLVIAGGGGGGGLDMSGAGPNGGDGGGAGAAADGNSAGGANAGPGGGGTQAAGGTGGAPVGLAGSGVAGSAGSGGRGGSGNVATGGGGGGGYFGGGGGGGVAAPGISGAGGGGSSFVAGGATGVSHTQGARVGNGLVVITW